MDYFSVAKVAESSADFRRVLWTGKYSQVVIMTIPAGGEIGEEVHESQKHKVQQGDLVAVPAGSKHNFVNTGPNPLVLYTVYGPPEHAKGAVHKTKEEADAAEESGKDEPPQS